MKSLRQEIIFVAIIMAAYNYKHGRLPTWKEYRTMGRKGRTITEFFIFLWLKYIG